MSEEAKKTFYRIRKYNLVRFSFCSFFFTPNYCFWFSCFCTSHPYRHIIYCRIISNICHISGLLINLIVIIFRFFIAYRSKALLLVFSDLKFCPVRHWYASFLRLQHDCSCRTLYTYRNLNLHIRCSGIHWNCHCTAYPHK